QVELRERGAAQLVDLAARGQVDGEAVAVDVAAEVLGIRQGRTVTEDGRHADAPRRAVEAGDRHAVTSVGVERTGAGAAARGERSDGLVAAAGEVGLVAGVGDAELVGAGEDVALGLRQGVVDLEVELLGGAALEAEVQAVVGGEAVTLPDAEVAAGEA